MITRVFRGFEGYKRDYKGLQGIDTVYSRSQGFTGDFKGLQGLKRFIVDHKGLQETTRG